MAKLNVEIKENGDMKYTLEFAGRIFDITMIRTRYGAKSDEPSLDEQVEAKLGDALNAVLGEFEAEEALETIADIDGFSTLSTINDCILALTEYEAQLKAEAMP